METKRISSGVKVIDELLNGGYECDAITTIYGPAGSGKTGLCIALGIYVSSKLKKKVIYVDTDGGFSIERYYQLGGNTKDSKNWIFFKPTSFDEQKKVFSLIKENINKSIGVVIVDSIAMLYRIELGTTKDIYDTNRNLGEQIAYLSELARKHNIPVIITNQVYSSFDNRNNIKMVGGDLLRYTSKCLIELQILKPSIRKAIIIKHRSIKENSYVIFKITETGFIKVKLNERGKDVYHK